MGWAHHTGYEQFFADKHVLVASPEVSTPFGRAAMTAMVARGGDNVHNALGAPTELASDLGARHMAGAPRAGGVPFTYDRYDNAAHTFALFERELRDSWRVVGPALGA